jgi:SAM-dependent MidA family methyltransferase
MERLDAFMARANAAYYARRDPYADFTTAPEISQVFGELIGAWAAVTWAAIGRPTPVILAEVGPGRGTQMADALRTIGQIAPDFSAAAKIHLIETSPRLRALQAACIGEATWHDRIEDLPAGPLLLIANEFFDVLPIRQFVRRADGWCERFVDDACFVEYRADPPLGAIVPGGVPIGAVVEIREAACGIVRWLARRVRKDGGAALIIDYGPEAGGYGDSLQALRDGRPADPLGEPGAADLTAHVNFAAIAEAARDAGADTHGPVSQGAFLTALGLYERTGRLARGLPARDAAALIEGARRLAEPDRMGRLFKVLALCQPGAPTLAGFESLMAAIQ